MGIRRVSGAAWRPDLAASPGDEAAVGGIQSAVSPSEPDAVPDHPRDEERSGAMDVARRNAGRLRRGGGRRSRGPLHGGGGRPER